MESVETKSLYDKIFTRKSVREFSQRALEPAMLRSIEEQVKAFEAISPILRVKVVILDQDQVRGLFKIKAPHYMALYGQSAPGAHLNAGFILQQMSLWLTANGLGSVYQGACRPKDVVILPTEEELQCMMILAFGRPQEPLERSADEFIRKDMTQIRDFSGADHLLEAVRLAPSAMNGQPWYFTGTAQHIRLWTRKKVFPHMTQVDMGIALCHLALAAAHHGGAVEFEVEEALSQRQKHYVITAHIR
ncbi:MAG: nitroreductase family protein [Christensenellales bacterium]